MKVEISSLPDHDDIYHGNSCYSWLDPGSHMPACTNPACYYLPQRHRCFSQANLGSLDNWDQVMRELTYYFQFLNEQMDVPVHGGKSANSSIASPASSSSSSVSSPASMESMDCYSSSKYDMVCPCLEASHHSNDLVNDCTIATATISFCLDENYDHNKINTDESSDHQYARMNPL